MIPNSRYDAIEYWLKWEITNISERNGKRDMDDNNFKMFLSSVTDAIRRESSGQKFKSKPKVVGINYYAGLNDDFDRA